MSVRWSAAAAALVIGCAGPTFAQAPQPSLAEIARQAELAKPTTPKAKKTYTNADLGAAGIPPAPPASETAKAPANQSPATVAAGAASEAAVAAAVADVQVEEVWRRRADRIRDQVKSLQARLTELSSRPPNPNPNLQQRADKEAAGIRSDFVQLRLQWTKLEQDARAAKVSIVWIEPQPAFPQ